jgi:hypothetical protein
MDETYEPRPRRSLGGLLLNLLTFFVLLATLAAGLVLVVVFINPYLPFNPFPPPTLPATLGYPTATNTPANYLPSTWTPTVSVTPTPTETAIPSPVPTETATPTLGTPGTQELTGTLPPYDFQVDEPIYMQNSFINTLGCNWMGVGGQVFDMDGGPVRLQSVHMEGQLGGMPIALTTLTGTAGVLGESGYIFDLATHPIASSQTLWIQLVDEAGLPLSEKFYLVTYDSCEQNFVLVNWHQVR